MATNAPAADSPARRDSPLPSTSSASPLAVSAPPPKASVSGTAVASLPPQPIGGVVQASYNAGTPQDWQGHLAAAISQLESKSPGAAKTDADVAAQANLRMLYLLAGRRNDALKPISGAQPALQDFWTKQLYGMSLWLDSGGTTDPTRRAAETKRILGEAMLRLGEAAPLVVHNLAFCTEVQSFGSIKPFPKTEFKPDQEVLLYAEIDNFTVEQTPAATTLRCGAVSRFSTPAANGSTITNSRRRKRIAKARAATSSSAIICVCRSESTTASTRCSLRSRTSRATRSANRRSTLRSAAARIEAKRRRVGRAQRAPPRSARK